MSNSSSSPSGVIGFYGLLAVVFITLKLCGIIAWSWWWVLFPLWLPAAALLVFVVGVAGVALLVEAVRSKVR